MTTYEWIALTGVLTFLVSICVLFWKMSSH